METKIEKYILESIRNRDCILILGSAFNIQGDLKDYLHAQTFDLKEHFLTYFKDIFKDESDEIKSFLSNEIAEEILKRRSRNILYSCIKEFVDTLPREPLSVHQNLVKICVCDPQIFEAIVTYNWDRLLEKAFDDSPLEERIHYKILSKDSDMRGYKHSLINILKLRGDIYDASESMTMTESDIDTYFKNHPRFVARLCCLLSTKDVILVGFSIEDFRLLHDGILRGLDTPLQAYLVSPIELKPPIKSRTLIRINEPQIKTTAEQFIREIYAYLNETAVGFSYNIRKNESTIAWYHEFGYLCDENLSEYSDEIIKNWPHLKEVIVVETENEKNTFMKLGRFSARFFENNVINGQIVAMSCGRTLESLIESLRENYYDSLHVFSTIVLFLDYFPKKPPMFLVEMLINKYKSVNVTGEGYHFPSLSKLDNPEVQIKLIRQELKRNILNADHIFLSIRGLNYAEKADEQHRSTLRFIDLVEKNDRLLIQDELKKLGYIAIQSHNPINDQGQSFFDINIDDINECSKFKELREKIVTISPAWLKEAIDSKTSKNIVTIAGGIEKLEAIRAVLEGKIANVLIIDRTIADGLIAPQTALEQRKELDSPQLTIKKEDLLKTLKQEWESKLRKLDEEKDALSQYIVKIRRQQGPDIAEDMRQSEEKKMRDKKNRIDSKYKQLRDRIQHAANTGELEQLEKDIGCE